MTDSQLPSFNLEELMRGCKKIILHHGQRPYYLTITRKGNLILTAAEERCHPTFEKTVISARKNDNSLPIND